MEFNQETLQRILELWAAKSAEYFTMTPPKFADLEHELKFKLTGVALGFSLGYLGGRSLGSMFGALVGYGCTAVILLILIKEDSAIDANGLIMPGIFIGMMIMLFMALWALLALHVTLREVRDSISSSLLLMPLFPFIGMQIASDMNRALDSTERTELVREVKDKAEFNRFLGSSGYQIDFGAPMRKGIVSYPSRLRVSAPVFDTIKVGESLHLQVRYGALGVPWYEKVVPQARTAP